MIQTDSRILDYAGAGMLIFVFLILVYGIIYIHDIPYEIAKRRQHPHQDAIHAAGWVSLFTLHAIWPFLWIWAMMHRPGTPDLIVKSAGAQPSAEDTPPDADRLDGPLTSRLRCDDEEA
ncbi:MAG: DUF3302 domain-containing protein [Desulfovibrionaceae bacterium]